MRRRVRLLVAGVLIVVAALVIRNQVKVYSNRQARQEQATRDNNVRRALFDLLQPVALANCQLQRFGEPHDGGYLMCGNLLGDVEAGYSYGISGYDQWGCDVATKLGVRVHQYDCFDTQQPACPGGDTTFHAECLADSTRVDEGRPFDTFQNQFARNGDAGPSPCAHQRAGTAGRDHARDGEVAFGRHEPGKRNHQLGRNWRKRVFGKRERRDPR